ncbi:hypothetical protein [Streptomyces sp. NPDC006134]|uniref:hypothetical protein n=1 Tax=Streptomyces sp. NPDC006134 TaxID=3154467 RepID=UPI0033FB16E6
MDQDTYALNCAMLVGRYGDEIERALRLEMERLENGAIAMENRHRRFFEKHGRGLVGVALSIEEWRGEAAAMRDARKRLAAAQEEVAGSGKAIEFVVVSGAAVLTAVIRRQAEELAQFERLSGEFHEATGEARTYIAQSADAVSGYAKAYSDIGFWIRNLMHIELEK